MSGPASQAQALDFIREQLREGREAAKCHSCGCFQSTVGALSATEPGRGPLAADLAQSRAVLQPARYDCLGCAVCYPALAANAFVVAFPEMGQGLDLCPTEEPEARAGWPPLPGDYRVVRFRAPVAICTLHSQDLCDRLADQAPEGLALVGTLHTENLGIERIIRNLLANPFVRTLILCGPDTRQAVGHRPGQSLQSLFDHGIDAEGRIREAAGRRPVLANLQPEEVKAFLEQVSLVSLVGETDLNVILEALQRSTLRAPGPYTGAPAPSPVPTVMAPEPGRLILDPAGYVVIYPDRMKSCLWVEHYTNEGLLDCVIEAATPGAASAALIERNLLTRLDHAAYVGRELARAERSLRTGEPFVQDQAPGGWPQNPDGPSAPTANCGCSGSCT